MTRKYKAMKATYPSPEAIDLIEVPHRGGSLVGSTHIIYSGYTSTCFKTDSDVLEIMARKYFNSDRFPFFSFRPATTSEAISIIASTFEDIYLIGPHVVRLGRTVITAEGVYVNPPRTQGNILTYLKKLETFRDKAKKVNGIYLGKNDFGFAPCESFKTGVQSSKTFSEGGLARVLEHTGGKKAEKFREIASSKTFKRGVKVRDYDKVKEPLEGFAELSLEYFSNQSHRLSVNNTPSNLLLNDCIFGIVVPN